MTRGAVDVEPALFRAVMARFPAPLTVITWLGPDGTPHGFTASSVVSVSLDPPLVLFCVAADRPSREVTAAAEFRISLLGRDGDRVARRFSGSADRFADTRLFTPGDGPPSLAAAVARLTCTVHDVCAGGDHLVVLGRVRAAEVTREHALTWCEGRARPVDHGPGR